MPKFRLRPIILEDVEFIYFLRTLSREGFLKRTNRRTNQLAINSIIEDENGEYLAYESSDEIIGYYRYYLNKKNLVEIGSWITNPSSKSIRKILMDIEFKTYVFNKTKGASIYFDVSDNNKSVLRHHLNYGAEIIDNDQDRCFFELKKENFLSNERAIKILKKYNI